MTLTCSPTVTFGGHRPPWFVTIQCCRGTGEFSENKCISSEEKGWNIRRITDAWKAAQIRSKLRASAVLPYKSTHDIAVLPKLPRSKSESRGTHLWLPLRGQQEALLSGRCTVPNATMQCAASQHRLVALSPKLGKKGVIGKSEQTSPASLSDRGLPSSMIPPLKQ